MRGLDLTQGPAELRRAAYEASGFAVRHILERGGVRPRRVVATGGGSRVTGWMQATADATGLAVETVAIPEGGALGAAFLAPMAAGLETEMTDAGRWSRPGRTFEPDRPGRRRPKRATRVTGPMPSPLQADRSLYGLGPC